MLDRLALGKHAKSVIPIGLRGVGKTVLLNRFDELAQQRDFATMYLEASEDGRFLAKLAGQVRSTLYQLDKKKFAAAAVNAAKNAVKAFSVTFGIEAVKLGIDIDPEPGVADSGDLASDLKDLLVALARAAKQAQTPIVILIDELQYLSTDEFAALIVALHRVSQLALPLALIGTGLPQVPGLAGDAKSYAERLFDFPPVGALGERAARAALQEPAQSLDVAFTDDALTKVVAVTQGYPYFLQKWGYLAWTHAEGPTITAGDVHAIETVAVRELEESFFRVRYDRLTPQQKRYLRAMAEFRADVVKSGGVAQLLSKRTTDLGPTRDALIKEGMIYSPGFNEIAFTVPLFGDFMIRSMPNVEFHTRRSVGVGAATARPSNRGRKKKNPMPPKASRKKKK